MQFKKASLHGTYKEIGLQRGSILKEEIQKNITFYIPYIKSILKQNYPSAVEKFKVLISEKFPDLYMEIKHVSQGADVDFEDLIVMNSRTELLVGSGFNECTAVVAPSSGILAQNWDWSSKLEETTVIEEIAYPDGHKILMLTEAGIIGKIGLNNHNIGITLNILRTEGVVLSGPPVHLIMRGVLEQKTLEDAISYIRSLGAGTSSNLIIYDGTEAYDIEYAGSQLKVVQILQPAYTHTNHFLHFGKDAHIAEEDFEDSYVRYNTVINKLHQLSAVSAEEIKNILSDQSHPEFNILADYEPYLDEHMGMAGTLASVIMNINEGVMAVRKGNPALIKFDMDGFKNYQVL